MPNYQNATAEIARRDMQSLAGNDPHGFKAVILQPEWRDAFLSSWLARLQAGKRDAIRLYAESVQLVGAKVDIVHALFVELGVRDKDEILRALNLTRSVMSHEEQRQEALTLLRSLHADHPEWRTQDALAIAGQARMIEAHEANGHANGAAHE